MRPRKSTLWIAAVVLVLCVCTGCGENSEPADTSVSSFASEMTTVAATDTAARLHSVADYRVGTLGRIEGEPSALPTVLHTITAEDLPELVPVFVDPYPINQAGPMFEFNAAYYQKSTDEIARYMRILLGDTYVLDEQAIGIAEGGQVVHYRFGTYTISGSPTGVAFFCDVDVSDSEGVLSSDFVAAMIEYCGIQNPEVRMVSYETSKKYTIAETCEDEFAAGMESSFTYVKVSGRIDGSEQGRVSGGTVDHSTVYALGEPISPEMVITDLQNRLQDGSIAGYEMMYRNDVDYGYYIPCYMFYIKQEGVPYYERYCYRVCLSDTAG